MARYVFRAEEDDPALGISRGQVVVWDTELPAPDSIIAVTPLPYLPGLLTDGLDRGTLRDVTVDQPISARARLAQAVGEEGAPPAPGAGHPGAPRRRRGRSRGRLHLLH